MNTDSPVVEVTISRTDVSEELLVTIDDVLTATEVENAVDELPIA